MIIKTWQIGPMAANCYLLIDEANLEAAVIDPGGYDPRFSSVFNRKQGMALKYILLTHGHYDHILGAAQLREETGARLAIHSADAAALENESVSLASRAGCGRQQPLQADLLLEDGMRLRIGSCELEVVHTPGHTPGGVCFADHIERRLFTGDTLFRLTIGRTDFPGGNMSQMLKSLKRLGELEGDYEVLPGHERSTHLSFERDHNTYMRMSL